MEKISRDAAEHYNWQTVCDGWHLLKRDDLSVITERMPPHTAEETHRHERARQFFYILSGTATMRFADRDVILQPGEGIEIPPLTTHQMRNDSNADTEFLIVSAPKSHGDRIAAEATGSEPSAEPVPGGAASGLDIDTLFFFEGRPTALSLYQGLAVRLLAQLPDVRIKISKTQISFYGRYLFGAASLPKRKKEDHLVVTFGLGYQKESPRVFSSTEAARNRWTHHVAVHTAAELDDELFGWLREAYEFAAVK